MVLYQTVLWLNLFLVLVYYVKKMDLFQTIYGSFQLVLVVFCTYFIIFLRGLVTENFQSFKVQF